MDSRRHDRIGGDVVPHLQHHLGCECVGKGGKLGQGFDVRTAHDHGVPQVLGGEDDGAVVREILLRVPEARECLLPSQVAGIGDHAPEGRGARRLGRTKVDFVVLGARASGKVPREGPQGYLACPGGLAHADAAVAAGLVHAGAGSEKGQHPVFPGDVFEHLTAAGVHMERGSGMDMPAFENLCRDHQVPEGGIDAAAHDHLVHLGAGHLPHGHDVAGRGGLGDQRLDLPEVKREVFVVRCALVGGKLAPRLARGPGPRGIPSSVRLRGRDCCVAPSSAPMLPMVSRSVAERVATPGP